MTGKEGAVVKENLNNDIMKGWVGLDANLRFSITEVHLSH